MSIAPALPPPASLPPPLSSGAPPGAPPPAQPFHSALAEEWARTAPAEGQQNDSRGADGAERPREGDGHRRLGADDASQTPEGVPSAEARVQSRQVEARPDSSSPSSRPASHEAPSGERQDPRISAPGDAAGVTTARGTMRELRAAKHGTSDSGHETALPGAKDEASKASTPKDAARKDTAPMVKGPADVRPTKAPTEAEGVRERGHVDRPAQPLPETGKDSHERGPVDALRKTGTGASAKQATEVARALATSSSSETAPASQSGEPNGAEQHERGHDPRAPARVPDGSTTSGSSASVTRSGSLPSAAELRSQATPRATLGGSTRARAGAATQAAGELRPASSSAGAQPVQASAAGARALQETGIAAEGGPLLDSGVDLQGMIDSIRATIEIATRQGMGQARIALQPAELGQIRIHLTQTSDGLLARVTADTPAAAQALAASRGELQQSLSSLGTSLLGLDIGSFKQPEGHDASASSSARSDAARRDDASIEAIEEPDGSSPAPRLPLGGLVDVLA
jgi:flagellar hook-length control protein FliK